MYPKKLVDISTHGKSVSHLVRSMPGAGAPTPPQLSCVPIGFNTIPTEMPDLGTVAMRFKMNEGEIITLRLDTESELPPTPELIESILNFLVGVHDNLFVQPLLQFMHKFRAPDDEYYTTSTLYVGGVTERGTVNVLGHDVNIENTVINLPDVQTGDMIYYRVGKTIRNDCKTEIYPVDGEYSYYDELVAKDFKLTQSLIDPNWTEGDSIIGRSCGALPMVSFIPSELGDAEIGYIEFDAYPTSDADGDDVVYDGIITIDGTDYTISDILDAEDGVVVNDGIVRLESQDGPYRLSACCTALRKPITIVMQNSRVTFSDASSWPSDLFENFKITDRHLYEAVLTPPAIAPFNASNQVGLRVPYGDASELWGVLNINGVSYGRHQFIDGYPRVTVSVAGLDFNCTYGDDDNFIITLGNSYGNESSSVNTNIYYKVEITFETNSSNLKPTNIWYQTKGWSSPLINDNPTTSLDVNANKLTAFMKYIEYEPR